MEWRRSKQKQSSTMQGNLDGVDGGRLQGWAAVHGEPVRFTVFLDGAHIASATSNHTRADLIAAGIGDRAFFVTVPEMYCDGAHHEIKIVDTDSGECVLGTPARIFISTELYVDLRPILVAAADLTEASYMDPEFGNNAAIRRIRDACALDPVWYAERYGVHPTHSIAHYLALGDAAGHNPSPIFDGQRYKRVHTDVAADSLNPLLHFLESGAKEAREVAETKALEFGCELTDDVWKYGL